MIDQTAYVFEFANMSLEDKARAAVATKLLMDDLEFKIEVMVAQTLGPKFSGEEGIDHVVQKLLSQVGQKYLEAFKDLKSK